MKTIWWRRSRWKVESPADCVARRVAFFSVPSSSGPAPAPSSAPSSTGSAPAPSSAPSSWDSTPEPSSAPMAWPAPARAHSRCQRLAHARRRKAHAVKFAPAPSPTCAWIAAAPPAMTRLAGQSCRGSQLRHKAQHRPRAGNRQLPSPWPQRNCRCESKWLLATM